jgi:hypothetical protein
MTNLGRLAMAAGTVAALALAGCGAGTAKTATSSSKTTAAASSTGAGGVSGAFKLPYDRAGFLAPGQSGPSPGFGPTHDLDNASAPKPGPYTVTAGNTKVTFLFPTTTGSTPPNDIVEVSYGNSVTLPAPQGKYHEIYFLAAVASGPEPATVTETYTDGSTVKHHVAFDDWCTVEIGHQPVPGTYPAWQGIARIAEADGSTQSVSGGGYSGSDQGCGLYVSSVPANPDKVLKSITISNEEGSVPSSLSAAITSISQSSRIGIVAITAQ